MREWREGRTSPQPRGIGNNGVNKAAYGQNTASGAYGRGTHSYSEATFDGLPAFKRYRAGQLEFFYGEDIHRPGFLTDHVGHGHALIKNGKLIYRCRPGETTPDIDIKE